MSTQIDRTCNRCGSPESQHLLTNYADGPHVGAPFLVCPTAVFMAPEVRAAWKENPPHETSDRTMRRAGSPPR